jgi:hypothetical protein
MYIPNPNKPGELSTLRVAVDALMECRSKGGGWDLEKLDRWLKLYPNQMPEAIETLDDVLDEHYPPMEVGA